MITKKIILTIGMAIYACLGFGQQTASIQDYLAKKNIQAKSEYGISYVIDKDGKGATIQKGDYVQINYSSQLLDETVFDASEKNEPFLFQVGYGQVIRGLDVGMTLLKKGSKAKLFVPANLAYGKQGIGKIVPPNAALLFEVEVVGMMNDAQYNDYMVALEKKERLAFEQHKKEQFDKDLKLIHEYAVANKIKTTRLPSGISYAISKKGKGTNAKVGDKMTVHYEGFLLNGDKFDASKTKKPYAFQLGVQEVIEGWDEGLQYFNKGAEGWLLIPSKMAYGPRSIEEEGVSIPGNAVLVFKIKVANIQKMDNTQAKR